jgi:hypothetical protein
LKDCIYGKYIFIEKEQNLNLFHIIMFKSEICL